MDNFRNVPDLASGLEDTPMLRMAKQFDDLASGRIQVPQSTIVSRVAGHVANDAVLAYRNLLLERAGPLFLHFLASVPCIFEELSRVGTALTAHADERRRRQGRECLFFEADAFDGANGRALASYSKGSIRTLTSSPNKANQPHFFRLHDPSLSAFFSGSCLLTSMDMILTRPDLKQFANGFDYVYEMAALQFYDRDRDHQIKHLKTLLRSDGIAMFLEKVNHPSMEEYQRREDIKDTLHKSHYFTEEEISWKKKRMLQQMECGQVDLEILRQSISKNFAFHCILWNSTNFYEIAASDDLEELQHFVSLLGEPCIVPEFCCDPQPIGVITGRCPTR